MRPINLATVALGIVCLALTKWLPEQSGTLLWISGLLVAAAFPSAAAGVDAIKGRLGAASPPSKDGGHATPIVIFLLLSAALAAFVTLAVVPRKARADANDPASGGCLSRNNDAIYNADGTVRTPVTCKVSAQMSMLAPTAVVDLKTGDALAGANAVALGPCYGVTYQPSRWYASGADICVTIRAATGEPNQYTGALMLHTARWGSIGIGTQGTQIDGRMRWHGLGLLALKLPVL